MKPQSGVFGILFVAFFVVLARALAWVVREHTALTLVCNDFGALSLALPAALVASVSVVVGIFFVRAWYKESDTFSSFAWLFLLAGGMSNLFERVVFGCVLDYIPLFRLTMFNVADLFLTIGVFGLLWRWYDRRGIKTEQ